MNSARQVLNDVFGFADFRGRQAEVIDCLAHGEHALVIMPTGAGKSLCYQIPALMAEATDAATARPNLVVVLSPLIALMKDQVDALERLGISAAYVNSSLSRQERETRYAEVAGGQYRLLYVTPERFRKPEFLDVIARRHVSLLAVDEAHCISQWGHDFRPDYSRVAQWRATLGNPPTVALTATATPEVQRDIVAQLGLQPDQVRQVHEGIERPNLTLSVVPVWSDEMKLEQILNTLGQPEMRSGGGIVYFTLIKTLERFSALLAAERIPHVCYHGDLERKWRRKIQNQFMQGRCQLVLATNAFGMGIDKEDIRFVLHAELPGSMEAYYQEIGRAGRDGRASRCTLLYDERDLMTQMEFIEWKNPTAEFYERVYDLLVHDNERVQAFGQEWLNQQLQCRSRHDHRLDTVLAMFDRHGVVRGPQPPKCFQVQGPLPGELATPAALQAKQLRDQRKLHALVEYANCEGNRKEFIHHYFGI